MRALWLLGGVLEFAACAQTTLRVPAGNTRALPPIGEGWEMEDSQVAALEADSITGKVRLRGLRPGRTWVRAKQLGGTIYRRLRVEVTVPAPQGRSRPAIMGGWSS